MKSHKNCPVLDDETDSLQILVAVSSDCAIINPIEGTSMDDISIKDMANNPITSNRRWQVTEKCQEYF